MWNGTMFVDLDWPLNASSLLSASAELLVALCYYVPAPNRRGHKRCFCLTSVWRLMTSVCRAYIGPKSRTKRPRKTKICTEEVAHVTRDSDTTFKVKSSRSPGRFGWLYWQANLDIELVTDPYACMMYIMSPCRPGRGILWRPPAYSLLKSNISKNGLS